MFTKNKEVDVPICSEEKWGDIQAQLELGKRHKEDLRREVLHNEYLMDLAEKTSYINQLRELIMANRNMIKCMEANNKLMWNLIEDIYVAKARNEI